MIVVRAPAVRRAPAVCLVMAGLLAAGCTSGSRATPPHNADVSTFSMPPRPIASAGSGPSAGAAAATGGGQRQGSGGGQLVAVDAGTGKSLWTAALPMDSVSTPQVLGKRVVVGGTSDCFSDALTLAAVDADQGHPAWQTSVASTPCGYADPLRSTGRVVVAGGPLGSAGDPDGGCRAAPQPRIWPYPGPWALTG